MPRMHFKQRFVAPILAGTKVHTVRAGKRLFRGGQVLQMDAGNRFHPDRFCEQEVLRVRSITISDQTVMVWNEDNSGFIVPPLDAFAKADGFKNWSDLVEFFVAMHGIQGPNGERVFLLKGQLVQWAPASWEAVPKGS